MKQHTRYQNPRHDGHDRSSLDILAFNRRAWDREGARGNPWTVPVEPEVIDRARNGDWSALLTPTQPVPRRWFPELCGADVLCLACGGGQQGPTFAAAGARVTVLDNSPAQLAQDRRVGERENLQLVTLQGDMADLSALEDRAFDLVFHPTSNNFAPHVRPVWREAYRVLRPGGILLAGFGNPFVRHPLPYSDLHSLPPEELNVRLKTGEPLEFSHSLQDQIGGQLDAGFVLTHLFEDRCPPHDDDPLKDYFPTFLATRAIKPRAGSLR